MGAMGHCGELKRAEITTVAFQLLALLSGTESPLLQEVFSQCFSFFLPLDYLAPIARTSFIRFLGRVEG